MENRCRRCNRILTNPEAVYGWRCAEKLGIAEQVASLDYDFFTRFTDGILEADKLFKNSNITLTDEQMNAIYAASAEAKIFEGLDDKRAEFNKRLILFIANEWVNIYKTKEKLANLPKAINEYVSMIKEDGFLDATSQVLAKVGKLDDVTNTLLKSYNALNPKETAILDENGKLIEKSNNKQGVENYKYNKSIDMSEYTKKEYINSQKTGAVSKLKFGPHTMSENGCEVIATYNTLITLGAKEDICDVAAYYEADGQMLNGVWGTNPYAAERYFKKKGYEVTRIEGDDILSGNIPDADAYLYSYWNTDKVTDKLHTVSVRKTERDTWVLYNYRSEKDRQYNADSIQECIKNNPDQPLLLLAIKHKSK